MQHGPLRSDCQRRADGAGAINDQRVAPDLPRWPHQRDAGVLSEIARRGRSRDPEVEHLAEAIGRVAREVQGA